MADSNKRKSILMGNKQKRKTGVYSLVLFIVAAILIFYPPYFRGLFFSEDVFLFHIATAVVFMLVCIDKIYRKDYNFLRTPLDWAVLAYALAYLLSITGAVHQGEAVYGFLKALNYFMVFWIVSQVVRSDRDYVNILRVLVVSALGVAVIGILVATGHINYPSAFDSNSKVILSTLQYPNTTAAFLAVATLLGVTLWTWEKNCLFRLFYSLANYLMILVVLAAMSKGAWLIFALGALLLLVGMPGVFRLKSLYAMAVAGTAAAFTAPRFLSAIATPQASTALHHLLIGLAIVIAGELVWEALGLAYRRRGSLATAGLVLILLALSICAGQDKWGEAHKYIQYYQASNLAAKFNTLKDTSGFSYTSRSDLYQWAQAIAKDYPLTGAGAGGWNALYHRYQNYLAWTTEVHNHYLQVWVEAGTIGLMAFMSMWVMLLYAIFKRWKAYMQIPGNKTIENKYKLILNWGTATAALAFGAHAAIDFDLSLGAMAVMLWVLFALVNAGASIDELFVSRAAKQPWILVSVGIMLTVLLLVAGQRMWVANHLFITSDALLSQSGGLPDGPDKDGKIKQVEVMTSQSCKWDPFNARSQAMYAQACAFRYATLTSRGEPGATEYRDKAQDLITRSEKLSPYDIKVRSAMLNSCILMQDYDGMVRQAHYLVEANPNDITAYETAIQVSLAAAEYYRNVGQPQQETRYLKEVVSVNAHLEKQKQLVDKKKIQAGYWQGSLLLLSSDSTMRVAKAHYLLGN